MERRLKVRFITRKWAPAIGGMETYCLRLTEHIKDRVDLDIHALYGNADGSAPGLLKIAIFGLRIMFKLLYLPRVDTVHVSDMASWPLAFVAKLSRPKTHIVISAHGSDLSYETRSGVKPKIYKAYMRLGAICLPRVTVLANSQWIADLAVRKGFKDVQLIPLATDMVASKPPQNISRNLLYAGRIMTSKGVSFIINDVLPRLPEDILLRVAGTIWDEEESEALGHPRVVFLGQLTPRELSKEYADALCIVVPSLAPEGFGLVAIEGALTGGVVLASDHTGLSEVCKHGLGLPLAAGNGKVWADEILSVASWSSEGRRKFIEHAQSEAKLRYSWQRVADETLDAYKPAI
ncbi:MAG: glycosyltransferase family 4 protein [Hellea sp.]